MISNDKIINFDKISFSYQNKPIFNNFSLEINHGDFLSIIGNNGSGKTTLIKIMLGLYKTTGDIFINGEKLNAKTIKKIIKKIGVVFDTPEDSFVCETVMHDLAFPLENLNIEPEVISRKVIEISKRLGIYNLLERDPFSLSGGERELLALGEALIIEPDILILDEAFSMIDDEQKGNIFSYLQELNEINGLTIINVTHDIEETLYSKDILILDEGNIILYDSKEKVYSNEKIFSKLGIKLPFMVELSTKLKYYGLCDDFIYDMNEMVDALWK